MDWSEYFKDNNITGEPAKQARIFTEPTIVFNACGQVKIHACPKSVDLRHLLYKLERKGKERKACGIVIFTMPDATTGDTLAKARKLRKCYTSDTDKDGNAKAVILPNIRLPYEDGNALYNAQALANPDSVEQVSSGNSASATLTITEVKDSKGNKSHVLEWHAPASEDEDEEEHA